MTQLASASLLGITQPRVALVDDRQDALTRACDILGDLPISVEPMLLREPRSLDSVLDEILGRGCTALISDHRLRHHAQVGFDGAELVYRANERKLPAVLYSAHVEDDETTSIREWRYRIPRVVRKGPHSVDAIPEALQAAAAEAEGHRALERRGFLTPIRIIDMHSDGYPTIDVTVTAWKPDTPITIPLTRLPVEYRSKSRLLIGKVFLGKVNFYAEDEAELFFHDLVLAPDVPADWNTE
ncbi:hypothetical protein ACH44C_13565 [Streptomyces purpureus]|uniref:hypothetical protein n=1 Tax=Streptomyces purpureus TaxID=1951 RepID=UPI0037A76719